MKKILTVMLALTLIFAFAACGGSQTGSGSGEDDVQLDGGWERTASPVLTDEMKELFNKAMEGLTGADYEPVAYIASQTVSGKNHLFIARTSPVVPDPQETYALVTIYEDTEGNLEILDINDSGIETNINGMMGGYEAAESAEITDELKETFDKLKEGLTGADYEPVALLSTQIVNGTNYCILCESTLTTIDPERSYAIAYLYIGLDGNSELTDIVSMETESDVEAALTPNPFIDAADLEEAEKIAGFDISVPESIEGYPQITIEAVENKMIQVFYYEGEFGEEGHKEVLIRKGTGTEDITGDYNEYPETETASLHGADVELRGKDGKVFAASWIQEGYAYAIDSTEGLTKEETDSLIEIIR